MYLPAFLRRLVRQVIQVDKVESLTAHLEYAHRRIDELIEEFDGMDTAFGCLGERVKELEEVEHLEESDISTEIDTVIESDDFGKKLGDLVDEYLEKQDPWNDPSFTGHAEEFIEEKLPAMIGQVFESLTPALPKRK